MDTLQSLQKRINTTDKLQGIVKSMKTLAAVSIRQYERSAASLDRYFAAIGKGLQVVLKEYRIPSPRKATGPPRRGLVVYGSDQGLCGRFNERLAEFVMEKTGQWGATRPTLHLLVVGARIGARLEALGFDIEEQFWVPGSVSGINHAVYQILLSIEALQKNHQVSHIDIFFNKHESGSTEKPTQQALLPLAGTDLQSLAKKKWPGKSVPQFSLPAAQLFSGLIRQYIFVSLFRAQAESLASEQASRLRSLQNAEKNIEEHLDELRGDYRIMRQASITSELLDLVAGYKISAKPKKY